jgi:hypothetical protein
MGSVIRSVAILASGIVLLGFSFFAVDEMGRGSQNQQNALASELRGENTAPAPIAPSPREELLREQSNGEVRELVDDANDVLLAPFAGIVESSTNTWVVHGVPTVLGLLTYGLLLGVVANMLPRQRETSGDWRSA